MCKKLLMLTLVGMASILTACGDSLDGTAEQQKLTALSELESSREKWEAAKEENGNSYKYRIFIDSGFPENYHKYAIVFVSDGEISKVDIVTNDDFVETTESLQYIELDDDLLDLIPGTLDDIYASCKDYLKAYQPTENYKPYLHLGPDGLVSQCGSSYAGDYNDLPADYNPSNIIHSVNVIKD